MPKGTFFNLPDEKSQKILDIAFKEFAEYEYEQASLSRIVTKAGIAKGSMYQYFEDKQELYLFLLEQAAEKKLRFITENLDSGEGEGFFSRYRQIILTGTYFDFTFPRYSLCIINAMHGPLPAGLEETASEMRKRSADYLRPYLAAAVDSGEVRNDIDVDLLLHTVNQLTLSIGEYIENKYNCSLRGLLKNHTGNFHFTMKQLENEVDQLIRILRGGLSVPNSAR